MEDELSEERIVEMWDMTPPFMRNLKFLNTLPSRLYDAFIPLYLEDHPEDHDKVRSEFKDKVKKEDLIIHTLKENISLFPDFGFETHDNKNIVLHVVKIEGSMIQYASERLRNDPEVIREALKQNKDSFAYKRIEEYQSIIEYLKKMDIFSHIKEEQFKGYEFMTEDERLKVTVNIN